MNKRRLWVIILLLCVIVTFIFILQVKVVKFYFLDYKGNPEISYVRMLFLPSEKSEALKEVISNYLKYAKNSYVNGELLPYMVLQNVRLQKEVCLLDLHLQKTENAELSSFSEDRSLVMLFKTIKSYAKDIKVFRVDGLENCFKHIDTRLPITLERNDLIVVTGAENEK